MASRRFVYRAPAYVDDELTFRSSVTDVRQKKGGALTMVDITSHVTNQRGEPVADLHPGRRRPQLARAA